METDLQQLVSVLRRYRIRDERILAAMGRVQRHRFIPEAFRDHTDAYGDHPCPIGYGQTISQPYIVAYMTQCLEVTPGMSILEIGTGSGYQTAVLAELGADVYSIEIIPELSAHAKSVLQAEGYSRVHLRMGDGHSGWPEHAPFDAIIITCAPPDIPKGLVHQLRDGGRMILPVGRGIQQLFVLDKEGEALRERADMYVRFVPMVRNAD